MGLCQHTALHMQRMEGKRANERTCDEQHVATKHERSNCNCTLSIDVMLLDSKHEDVLYFSLRATLYLQDIIVSILIDIVVWVTRRI